MRATVCAGMAILTLLSAPVFAENTVAIDTPPPPAPPARSTWVELRLGALLGASVGDASGGSVGLAAASGYRRGALTLLGELQYAYIEASTKHTDVVRGSGGRVTAIARLTIPVFPDGPAAADSWDLWIEGGAGYEYVAWHGAFARPFAALGFGYEYDGRSGRGGERLHFGPYVGFRAQLAHAPMFEAKPACRGPCARETSSSVDPSLYVVCGVHFGR